MMMMMDVKLGTGDNDGDGYTIYICKAWHGLFQSRQGIVWWLERVQVCRSSKHLCTVHCHAVQEHCALCTVKEHYALCTVHCTLCTVHRAGAASTCPRIHLSATFERRSCPGSTEKVLRHLLFFALSLFHLLLFCSLSLSSIFLRCLCF